MNKKPRAVRNSPYNRALSEGLSNDPDIKRLIGLLRDGVREDDPWAIYALAKWYIRGVEPFIKRDINQGVRLLKASAQDNLPVALGDLARAYESGAGVRQKPLGVGLSVRYVDFSTHPATQKQLQNGYIQLADIS
ncbi:MAG: sel1 repeat family protein [Candidatus Eremiobacteraeota bacterium]|nr:sel1 repeat family protein [Candidatus Eremiobacteraeota bacterium]